MATIKQIKDTEGNVHDILSTIGYGTCTTAAATAAKVATISDTSWTLKVGSVIGIKFTYTNSAGSLATPVTLNVNNTGAKNIWYSTSKYTSTSSNICGYANRVIYYMYDGTYWVWMNSGALDGNSDTKTSSSNKASTKLYLVGATTQSTSGLTTYSNSNCYVGTDNCLYSNGKKVLVDGVDGNEHSSMLSVNYLELVNLRDNGQLIPGQQYRITDYVTTVSLGLNEISAGHVFDIIVTADSENILNEEARVIQNDNDTYFNNSNLSAWKIWYSLDNDEDRFNWANEDGYGVIYRMIDEYGNDCPYDFKNIQFKVDDKYFYTFTFVEAEDLNGLVYDISCKHSSYSGSVYNNVINRYISNNIQYLNGITFISYVLSNDEGYSFGYNFYNNTFGNNCYNNTFGNNCYNNTFGNECYSNTFGDYCYSNTFGNGCDSNTFGNGCDTNRFCDYCQSNKFGNECTNNTFGNRCYSNTFGNICSNNTFGSNCDSNTFGTNCDTNTFGNECYSNTFGVGCDSNTFGNECSSNKFGDRCYSNTFDTNCDSNTFGNECTNNTFGIGCDSNTFGNNCTNNTFGNNCRTNIFGTLNSNNEFDSNAGSCSRNTFGTNCYNNKLFNSCQNNSFDIDCHDNEFGASCTYNKFDTLCAVIKFGSGCSYNTLGNGCIHITFGTSISPKSYYRRITIDSGNQYIYLYCTTSTGTGSYYQNVRIGLGVNNSTTYKTISDGNTKQTFETNYKPSETQTILI